jgi:hypothetical protein
VSNTENDIATVIKPTVSTQLEFNREDIVRTFELLCHGPGNVVEVRVPIAYTNPEFTKVISGYFNNSESFESAIMEFPTKYRYDGGIYATLNEVNPDLFARSANKFKLKGVISTKAEDIIRLRWILVDLDPVRPTGISSTEEEHNAAIELARIIKKDLIAKGLPKDSFVVADSGNGSYLMIRIDLPNDSASADIVKGVVYGLDRGYSNDKVHVDLKTIDAPRIMKVLGTIAKKGSDVPNRPHRLSRLLEYPRDTTDTGCFKRTIRSIDY